MSWTVLARGSLALGTCALALWLSYSTYWIGLDFEGGATMRLAAADADRDAIASTEELLSRLGLEATVRPFLDEVSVELPGGSRGDVERIEAALSASKFEVRSPCRPSWPPSGVSPPAGVEWTHLGKTTVWRGKTREVLTRAIADAASKVPPPADSLLAYQSEGGASVAHCLESSPVVTGADIVEATPKLDADVALVEIRFSEDAGRRFHEYTKDHRDEALALLVDGAVVMAPVIREPVDGGTVALTLERTKTIRDAEVLASRLNAASLGLRVLDSDVITPAYSPSFGRPAAVTAAALGALAWVLLVFVRRLSWPLVALATLASAGVAAEVYFLARGGTMTAATHGGAICLALAAASLVAFSAVRAPEHPTSKRLVAAWPGLVACAIVFFIAIIVGSRPGYWRGLSLQVVIGIAPALVVGFLGVLALRGSATSRV